MAVSGSMTTAYKYTAQGDAVRIQPTTYPSSQCAQVQDAAVLVLAGGSAIVAGGDAFAMRELLVAAGKAVGP